MSLTVTLAEVEADFGRVREQAGDEPVRVLQDGREVVYLVPPGLFHALSQGSRRAVSVGELTEEEWDMIANAEVPEGERYELEDC